MARWILIFVIVLSLLSFAVPSPRAWSQSQTPVATISAANFRATIAPDSVVASFGVQLATGTKVAETVPLPTQLLGTVVTVRDSKGASYVASLLFVSPGQINYIVPAQAAPGAGTVSVRSGDGKISEGTVQIAAVAPGVFTANQDGTGVPAADVLRVLANGQQRIEPSFTLGPDQRFIPRSIDLGPEGERVFLILYVTGLRGAPNTDGNGGNGSAESVKVLTGGIAQTPLYAGAQGSFAGLDQINLEIPRSLLDASIPGSKQVEISVKIAGFPDSNAVEIALAPPAGASALQITGVTAPEQLVANSVIQLNGSGISATPEKNKISFGEGTGDPRPGEIRTASTSLVTAVVPFGVQSGNIALNSDGKRWTSQAPMKVRTSFSAVIKDTEGQLLPPVVGARVCFPDCTTPGALSTTLQPGGWFVLPDTPVGTRRVFVIEPLPQNTQLPFNRTTISSPIVADRDNHLPQDIFLQTIYGPSGVVGTGNGVAPGMVAGTNTLGAAPSLTLAIAGFRFTVTAGADATFPNGSKTGLLTLTPVKNSLTPVPLPQGVFSSAIVQISPFGARLNPGGTLVFPNTDNLTSARQPILFKYEVSSAGFVDTGVRGIISDDGRSIETPPGAITEASIYFFALPQPTTTVAGRVLDSDGVTPIRGAVVRANGRQTATDGNGGFSLQDVSILPGENGFESASTTRGRSALAQPGISVTASYLRPSGRTDTARADTGSPNEGGITNLPPLQLSGSNTNRPPAILVQGALSLYVGETVDVPVLVVDPDSGQAIASLTATGASFASVLNTGGGSFTLRLAPGPGSVGSYDLNLQALDAAGASANVTVTADVLPLPIANPLTIATNEDTPAPILLTGSDAGSAPLTFAITSQPLNGLLSGGLPNLTYTPSGNFNGSDSFSYTVSNGRVSSAPAKVSIQVNPVNDAPGLVLSCVNGPILLVGEKLVCTVFLSDADGQGGLVLSSDTLPAGASLNADTGAFEWIPLPTQTGLNDVRLTVTDSGSPPLSDTRYYQFEVFNPMPVAVMIVPSSALAGDPGKLLTVTGSGFVPGSVVQWNGTARTTTFIDSGQLTALIPPVDLAIGGLASVTVFSPAPGGGTSAPLVFTINNPAPVAGTLAPPSAQAGGAPFPLTVNGSGFVSSSVVRWNGSPRTTTFVTPTQLTAAISAADILTAGTANVDVFNSGPGGGTSAPIVFTITDPSPIITGTSPMSALAGGPGFALIVTGSNFFPDSVVKWGGSTRPTTYNGPTQLTALITMADIADGGMVGLTVFNSITSLESAPFAFTISNPLPILTTAFPDNIPTGSGGLAVGLTGSNFVPSSVGLWNGASRTTFFVNSTQLIVTITASDFSIGSFSDISVTNPLPGGGTSGTVPFVVTNPPPGALIAPSPSSAIAGSPDTLVQIMGSSFVPNSVVNVNGMPRSTTYLNVNTLTVVLLASDLALASVEPKVLTVTNPPPIGGSSAPGYFQVNNPVPITTSINPTGTAAGGPQFELTVNGSGFYADSVVQWNGTGRPTTFVNSTQLKGLISAADIQTPGTADITVFNDPPGGGTSAPAIVFTIGNPVPAVNPIPSVPALSPDTVVTVTGTGFTPVSQIKFDGIARATTFVDETMISTTVTASELATGKTISVTVFNPPPSGGTSNAVDFTILNPAPVIGTIEPPQIPLGTPGQILVVTGTGFVSTTVGMWNGAARTTNVDSSTQLTITLPASDLTTGGNNNVSLVNPAPGGGTSANTVVPVNNPLPTLVSLVPDSIQAGEPAFVLTVNGTDFVNGIVLKWNDTPRPTTFINSTQLTAQIATSDVEVPGGVEVSATNPVPGGGNSNVIGFTILAPFGPFSPPWGEEFSQSWSLTGPLNVPRSGLTATRLGSGAVLVVGGRTQPGSETTAQAVNSSEVLDPSTGQWKRVASMRLSRAGHSATFVPNQMDAAGTKQGYVLVVGGEGSAAQTAEAFDPIEERWREVNPPRSAHVRHTATLLADGRVLISGGEGETGSVTATTEIFDRGTGAWTRVAPLNIPRSDHSAVLLKDGRVLVIGGTSAGGPLASAELYDPATGLWQQVSSLNVERSGHTATLLNDGRVLVIGGLGDAASATAEVFDPETGKWTLTAKLATARSGHTAALLPDGSVLIGGGQNPTGKVLVSCETFDPQNGVWSSAPPLNQSRVGHAALVLDDGRLLVVGGRGEYAKPRGEEPLPANPRLQSQRRQR